MFDTMMILKLILAAIANMAIGFVWYLPSVFGNLWMKLCGYKRSDLEKEKESMGVWYSLATATAILQAAVMSYLFPILGVMDSITGAYTAVIFWLGFVATTQFTGVIFGKNKSMTLFSINTGYQLVALAAMGAIIAW